MVEGADIAGHEIHLISTLSCVSFPAGQQIGDQSGLASKLIPLMPNSGRRVLVYLYAGLNVADENDDQQLSCGIQAMGQAEHRLGAPIFLASRLARDAN